VNVDLTADTLPENQISANYRLIEIIGKKPPLRNLRYHKISQIAPNFRYVDDISTLGKVQISWLEIVKLTKS